MTLNISVPNATQELRPKITVVGVGGAGGNAVNNMISADLKGVDFIVANTDGQALASSLAERKIQLGRTQTQGLGAGSKPEIGRIAAEESIDDILAELTDSHMVFITAGMGGGTGTGAAPVIARACREQGILTVGVITKPFDFEGQIRMRQANSGIEELQAYVDTLIIIPNQNLFRLANERTTFADAFAMADQVLHQGVCGITDLMIKPGTINLDFADIRSVMAEMGKAMMGTGESSGENRATNAAEAAINNPLLDETSMKGAQAVLINITGGNDMTLFEVDEAANHIRREVDAEATIIFGSALDDNLDGIMRVSVVATGIESSAVMERPPAQMTTPMVRHLTNPQPIQPAPQTPVMQTPTMSAPAQMTSTMDISATPAMEVETSSVETSAVETSAVEKSEDEPAQAVEPSEPEETVSAETPAPREDFSFSPVPPMMEEEEAENPEQDTDSASNGYFSDDPNQQNLMDMVAGADTRAGPKAEDEAFILSETVDPQEELVPTTRQGGLIRHLSRVFSSKDTAPKNSVSEATPKAAEPMMSDPLASATMAHPGESSMAETRAEDVMSEPLGLYRESPVEPAEEGASETAGLAALKPTTQEQLDINAPAEDIDLEIPAFLRRQAN